MRPSLKVQDGDGKALLTATFRAVQYRRSPLGRPLAARLARHDPYCDAPPRPSDLDQGTNRLTSYDIWPAWHEGVLTRLLSG